MHCVLKSDVGLSDRWVFGNGYRDGFRTKQDMDLDLFGSNCVKYIFCV